VVSSYVKSYHNASPYF